MRYLTILAVLLAVPAHMPVHGDDTKTRVDRIFAAYDKPTSPGCALGVIQDGNFVYRRDYGMANLELGVPLSAGSVFYVGSISKQFTAASIVLASEQGFLSLDDDVRKYIPEIPNYGPTVTLRHMLHQSSGFADILGLLWISGRNYEDIHPTAELLNLIEHQKKINFNPGEEYQYSNTNYFLLGEVLKSATHKSLAEFAEENIFRPLGMTHTRFYDDRDVIVPGRVSAYGPASEGKYVVGWSTNYEMVGGGGLMTTVGDLLLWDRNFYDNKLGKGSFLKEMLARGKRNDGTENMYALGLILDDYRGLPVVEHNGALFGYRAAIVRFPQQRFTVVVLCNVANAEPEKLSRKVADVYLEKEFPAARASGGSDPEQFVGTYFDTRRHYPISFTVARGKLVLQGDELEPIGLNRFEDPVLTGVIGFSNENGTMKATVNYNHAVTFTGNRINESSVDPASLAAYAGVYKSAELDAAYEISVESGGLALRMNWGKPIKLKPIIPDEFDAQGMAIVFKRNANRNIGGLSVFGGWDGIIRDEEFVRTNTALLYGAIPPLAGSSGTQH